MLPRHGCRHVPSTSLQKILYKEFTVKKSKVHVLSFNLLEHIFKVPEHKGASIQNKAHESVDVNLTCSCFIQRVQMRVVSFALCLLMSSTMCSGVFFSSRVRSDLNAARLILPLRVADP